MKTLLGAITVLLLVTGVAQAQTFTITLGWEIAPNQIEPDGFKIVWDEIPRSEVERSTGAISSAAPYKWVELFPGPDATEATITGVGAGFRCFRVSSYKMNPPLESPYSNEVCATIEDDLILRLHMPVNITIKRIQREQ